MVTTCGRICFDSRKINYVHPEAFIASRFGVQRPRTVGVRATYDF